MREGIRVQVFFLIKYINGTHALRADFVNEQPAEHVNAQHHVFKTIALSPSHVSGLPRSLYHTVVVPMHSAAALHCKRALRELDKLGNGSLHVSFTKTGNVGCP